MSEAVPIILPPVESPDLTTLLGTLKDQIFSSLNCVQIGTIQSFNIANQTATVSINFQRVVQNQRQTLDGPYPQPAVIAYPLLVDVPVFVLNGGGASITFPITKGDTCLLLFNDRCMDSWYSTGGVTYPSTGRMHSLSDGIALVGIRSIASPSAQSGTAAEFKFAGGIVRITSAGNVKILSANGAVIDLTTTINLQNAATTMKAAMDSLFAALLNWVDSNGDTPNGATIAALNAAKALSDSLFT